MKIRGDMVCVYVVRRDASRTSWELLQMLREPNDYIGGTWQTVYGCAEPNEHAVAAALRELREEAGLRPSEFYRLGVAPSFYTDSNDTLWIAPSFCAVVEADALVTLNSEHTEFRWIPRDRVDEAFMWPTDRLAIASLFRDVLDNGLAKPHLRIEIK